MSFKLSILSWSQPNTRTDSLAYHLGVACQQVHYFRSSRRRLGVPLVRYALAALRTWSVLRRERADCVLVSTPPPFAVLAVWFYCLSSGSKFVIDTHSAAFNVRRWKIFLWMTRFLARQAVVNIFHSKAMAGLASNWGVRSIVLGEIPYHLETGGSFPTRAGFNLAFPCTFAEDEPVEAILEAAGQLPEVNFYITGDLNRAPEDLSARIPQNVLLTGYLPYPDYVALLQACHGVLALTTRDLTVQNAAYEAIELGVPLITSDWPVLKAAYPMGAIYADNTPAGLFLAVQQLQAEYPHYCAEIQQLREKIHAGWQERLSTFFTMIE